MVFEHLVTGNQGQAQVRPKILLIDESVMLRRIAANVLGAQPHGFEVMTSTRASEGFARACSSGARLIFLDDQLPDLSGLDLCQRLLGERRTAAVPVVLLLQRGSPSPQWESLPANVVATLHKPFTPESFAALARCAIEAGPVNFSRLRARLQTASAPRPAAPHRAQLTVARSPSIVGRAPVRGGARLPAQAMAAVKDFSGKFAAPSAETRPGGPSFRGALHLAAGKAENGVWRIRAPRREPAELYLESGRVIVVGARDAADYAQGAREVLPAKVLASSIEQAVAEQTKSGVPFFLNLGARGLLPKAAAVSLMRDFGWRHVARLCASCEPLAFDYEPLEALPGFALQLDGHALPLDEWILEMLRQLQPADLSAAIQQETLLGVPAFRVGGEAILEALTLTPAESDFAARVNARNDLPAIARLTGVNKETAFLLMHRLRCLDVIQYQVGPRTFVVTPRTNVRRILPLKR
jgi:CheY-like chemotaxis protein